LIFFVHALTELGMLDCAGLKSCCSAVDEVVCSVFICRYTNSSRSKVSDIFLHPSMLPLLLLAPLCMHSRQGADPVS